MFLFVALATGCKVVVAPDNLQELAVFAFVNYDDPDAAEPTATAYPPLVEANLEDLQDGLYVDSLSSEDLAAIGLEGSATDILGAMGVVDYRHSLDEVMHILTAPNKSDFYENTPMYEVLEETDRECFLARDCETFEMRVTDTTEVTLLGEATRTYDISWRWVETEEGDWMILSRTLNPDGVSFNTDILNVFQQYAMICFWEIDGKARRVESFWVDAEFIGIDVPKSFAVDSAVGEMTDAQEQVDDALDAGW